MQDFSHAHTFRGHEHRVTALVYVDEEQLCISGDNSGGIFVWAIRVPFGQDPIKKWYEEKDWRYSGIHALTISGNGYLYTGSGDKSIKAWSVKVSAIIITVMLFFLTYFPILWMIHRLEFFPRMGHFIAR